jgi:hypothetical protein
MSNKRQRTEWVGQGTHSNPQEYFNQFGENSEWSGVELAGQEFHDPQHQLMGVYERLEGMEVNMRGVWQKLGSEAESESFLFYSSNFWLVSNKVDGNDIGNWLMAIKSSAITPHQITADSTAYCNWVVRLDSTAKEWEHSETLTVLPFRSVAKQATDRHIPVL